MARRADAVPRVDVAPLRSVSREPSPEALVRYDRAQRAVAEAEALLRQARAQETPEESAQARRLTRLMDDPHGKELTIALIDQAFRSERPARIADQLAHLLDRYGTPRYMRRWERIGLSLARTIGRRLPRLVVPPVVSGLRRETRSLIVPGEEDELRHYLARRRAAGIRVNLNQLGEAILGETEAARRLEAYLALLAREDVEYISVKLSSVFSQIDLVAYRATLERVKERLRALYREALRRRYQHPDGHLTPKFVNLDMEEYRDVDLTVAAFREVLDEDEFLTLPAGLVLQAYLPESHRIQRALVDWATERCARGGAAVKLRIVKGANLAMERVEASVRGWPQAPYPTKLEVDANFVRMLEYGCRPEHARAVHLGVASHNLFAVAYGLVLREEHGADAWVEFEMLEGMANHQARAVQARTGGLLLYAPVVRAEDFHSAVAYLVRRLDENTSADNFLRHAFALEPGSPAWERERDRFLSAFEIVDELSETPRRTQDRSVELRGPVPVPDGGGDARAPQDRAAAGPFANEPDTDFSLAANRAWIDDVIMRWRDRAPEAVLLDVGGELTVGDEEVDGRDRSRPGRTAYRHALAGRDDADRALDAARAAQPAWAARAPEERRALLDTVAELFARRRGDLIGAMIVDGAKTVAEADPEVSEAIDFARYYGRAVELSGDLDGARIEPLGVVVVAPPWNVPLSIPASGVFAALAAGSAAILKPAPEAVLVGWHLVRALWDAGIPKEVVQFLPCPDGDVGRMLVTDPRVDAVVLTGSIVTARRFLAWRPDLRLFAETSGKNAMIITALADRDQAVRDLVRSAFGHDGQKCSAASLAICEAEVYDDPDFRRQLRDAAASLAVGSAWDPASRITPLTQPPGEVLRRALTTLEPDEEWLLEPQQVGGDAPLWSPGIKLGVRPGSFFHRTECFGPVLGVMRAVDLGDAIALANDTPFGLTSGLHSLDDREVERWMGGIEAGNLYVNRHTTGALVARQPFGGWKASSVGPGAKAGGPNYVLQLARWRQDELPAERAGERWPDAISALLDRCLREVTAAADVAVLRASAASYVRAWQGHFGREHELVRVLGERNVFTYRPCRGVLVRGEATSAAGRLALCQALLAAAVCGVGLRISLAAGQPWSWLARQRDVEIAVESESAVIARLRAAAPSIERLRLLVTVSSEVRMAAHEAGIAVLDDPVLASGRVELRCYLREQTISQVLHRYGNVLEPAGTE